MYNTTPSLDDSSVEDDHEVINGCPRHTTSGPTGKTPQLSSPLSATPVDHTGFSSKTTRGRPHYTLLYLLTYSF
jgi:hypothetical protein